jgi:CheY-like chemotaxis protein
VSQRNFDCMLVASRNALMDSLLIMALADAGYSLAQAHDDQDALESLQARKRLVVVLMYRGLPTLAGLALLPAVAAIPHLAARIAFVLVTPYAEGMRPLVAGLPEQLAVSVLNMPFGLTELLDTVDQAGQRLTNNAAPAV